MSEYRPPTIVTRRGPTRRRGVLGALAAALCALALLLGGLTAGASAAESGTKIELASSEVPQGVPLMITYSTDAEVAMVLSLPVLAVVPLMKSAREHKRAFMNRMAINAGLGATVVGCLAIVAYTLVR